MDLEFTAPLWYWRGPSPFHFLTVPERESGMLEAASALVTYGWGMIPVDVTVGATRFPTALWPKDGGYIVPLKAAVRKAEKLEVGDDVAVRLTVDV
jgi:hypothetical protein